MVFSAHVSGHWDTRENRLWDTLSNTLSDVSLTVRPPSKPSAARARHPSMATDEKNDELIPDMKLHNLFDMTEDVAESEKIKFAESKLVQRQFQDI